MRNLKRSMLMSGALVLMWSVQGVFGQSGQPQTSSAGSLERSGIRASEAAAEPRDVLGGRPEKQSFSANRAAKPRQNESAIRVDEELVRACAEAVEELRASRVLIAALEKENRILGERLETEKRAAALLAELNETRRSEGEALRAAVGAKSDVIAAKDEVIKGQERLIEALKKKKSSPWKRVGDVVVGIAAGVLLR